MDTFIIIIIIIDTSMIINIYNKSRYMNSRAGHWNNLNSVAKNFLRNLFQFFLSDIKYILKG